MPDSPAEKSALDGKPNFQIVSGHQRFGLGIGFRRFTPRLSGQQHFGVFMLGCCKQLFDRSLFHHLALLHDADIISHMLHDAKIMGDQQQGHAEFLLQVFEQLKNLCLHRYVKCRRRFISDQQVGIIGKRHGNHHALALAA